MNERFASVWDALPPGLRDSMPLTSDTEIEHALFDAARTLAEQKGFALVRSANGYRLSGPGQTFQIGTVEGAATAIRKLPKTPAAALAGAGGVIPPAGAENTLKAVWLAFPIATNNWTGNAENATRGRDTETVGQSNE